MQYILVANEKDLYINSSTYFFNVTANGYDTKSIIYNASSLER